MLGGNGYVDTGVMARLFREAPVNSIWEGSGNVMCLDVLRAISREPDGAQLLLQDLIDTAAGEPALLQQAQSLARRLSGPPDQLEAQARRLAQDLVLLAQACLLRRHAPPAMADGFIATRLGAQQGAMVAGASTRQAWTSPPSFSARCPPEAAAGPPHNKAQGDKT